MTNESLRIVEANARYSSLAAVKTTVLLTPEESVQAMRKAGESVYKPPSGEKYYPKE